MSNSVTGLGPTHARHEHVHQNHIKRIALQQGQAPNAAGGFDDVGLGPYALAYITRHLQIDGVVVYQQHSQGLLAQVRRICAES